MFYLQVFSVIIAAIIFLIPLYMISLNRESPDQPSAVQALEYINANIKTSTNKLLLEIINQYNKLQMISNERNFGPMKNDTVIIIVQVHKRINYLKNLIASLAKAKNISDTLLVFSHDYYDEEINDLVKSIDFCMVLQIFYPYSIQTHELEFPGEDPNDCPRNIWRDQAISLKCNNALYPDLYGHYREAKFTQPKHHFWWKMNIVFDQLKITRHHTGLVLFLEEDYYLAEDFLHILTLMQKQSNELCTDCNIFSLGAHLNNLDHITCKHKKANEVEVCPWIFGKHNMGFAFNRSTWNAISMCAKEFCTYDDYNYDWSLQFISNNCLPQKLRAIVSSLPRVFHVGECGLHQQKENCNPDRAISIVRNFLRNTSSKLFTKKLRATNLKLIWPTERKGPLKPNGGWSDIRDHNLCLSYTASRQMKGQNV